MSESRGDIILEDFQDPVVFLRLNRPGRRNATGPDMQAALVDALDRWARDSRARACVLTGAEIGAFSSGADLGKENTHATPADAYLGALSIGEHPVFDTLLRFPKPLIAAVSGYAIGWGFLTCLACDVIVASRSAEFRLPQAEFGVLPAYAGVGRLAQWVGRGRAMEIAIRRRAVSAEEGLNIGLVTAVCEEDQLASVAYALAQECAQVPSLAFKMVKDSMYQSMEAPLKAAAISDLYRLGLLEQTQDVKDAHRKWREHRDALRQKSGKE